MLSPIPHLFATALDADDYAAVARLLSDDCEYLGPSGMVVGRDAVISSYRSHSAWAKSHLQDVRYTSTVRQDDDGTVVVTFSDHLKHDRQQHTYTCEQVVQLNGDQQVCRIVHREIGRAHV